MNMPRTFLFGGLVIAAGAWSLTQFSNETVVIDQPIETSTSSIAAPSSTAPAPTTPNIPAEKPDSVRLQMPFASQAPTGNWDPPYDEACEEASLIIARHYLESTPLDATIMDREIHAMVAHETSVGLPIDIDMHELAQVARDLYGYDTQVLEGADVSIARIEQELARGNPVILPLAGQDIGNPYYSGDGPPYHVLVVVGYGSAGSPQAYFLTHDVGTRRGEYYTYPQQVLMNAIHDWNGSVDTIRSGPKRMLVVTK